MSGLILNLKPGEKFLVNGIVLENGPKRGQIKVEGDQAKILRLSDALHPNDVNTPVKQAYYMAQLVLSGDIDEAMIKHALLRDLRKLEFAMMEADSGQLAKAIVAATKSRYYSVLCHLKRVLPLEAKILAHSSQQVGSEIEQSDIQKPDTPEEITKVA